ncbi:MAG: TOBE domain-containing protein [Solirubrobacteraceae bacterium]
MPARPGDCAPGRSATTPAVPTRRHNRFTGVVRSVDNDGVMALVEIEAGPFLVTSAITRDAMEELALAPGVQATAGRRSP